MTRVDPQIKITNPLLEEHTFPPFEAIRPEHVEPAISQRIKTVWTTLETCLAAIDKGDPPSWENLVAPLEEALDLLSQSWSPANHLNSVQNTDVLREIYAECLALLTEFSTAIDQHEPLYRAYQKLRQSSAFQALSRPQRKVIDNALRDFRLAGVALPEEKKKRYGEIKKRLSALSTQFSNNVLDATQAWHLQFDSAESLSGLPESALASAQQAARQRQLSGYRITLDMPSYLAVMTHADDRELREQVYRAFATRAAATEEDAEKWDNSATIEETLALRHELACLLGFNDFAERSLATKMAETPKQVMDFLYDLAEKSKYFAEKDLRALKDFARSEGGVADLQAWDIAYYSEKLRQRHYAVSQEALRPYFPLNRVLDGLFAIANKLFSIDVELIENAERYHPDVGLYAIKKAGKNIAYFYLDLYARDKKRGGAWMADCRTRRSRFGKLQLPVAYLTTNFTSPIGDKPSLLTHAEVTTLFHEFGHGLHHMLTQMTEASVSGIAGVAWDAVELPSQFLENWCWQKTAIPLISGHFESGEPLPEALLDNMLAARNFQSGMQMLRQLEFALFDMHLHTDYDPKTVKPVQQVLDEVRAQIAVTIPPAFNKFQNSFNHIFAGGYAAGYYSYKWAEVLSADAFSRFEKEGVFNAETGQSFLETILEKGGSQEPMELFRAFRGREPSSDALLKHSGLEAVQV
ncbi:MAG: oligopeptidase A [Cellvibrionaceae bacterium]|jgi:oligopeptidase A